MKYRPEIDGLRALAVVPVILFHARVPAFGGGFVGVDIFFVISGYLITTIIMADIAADRFSIRRFYERRARRILPLLFFVILCTMPFAWIWFMPRDMNNFAQSVGTAALFVSNFHFWLESGYFDTAAELKPLLHTWSLAVEEQYYILFPFLLILAGRWSARSRVLLFVAIFAASLAVAELLIRQAPMAAFYLLPARGWELMIGAFTAVYLFRGRRDLPPWLHNALSALGLVLILAAVLVYDRTTPFPGLYALLPTGGAALIILFATPGTLAHRLLSARPVVGVGLISYGAYLWHQPLLAFFRYRFGHEPGAAELAVILLLVFGLAAVTWRLIETPFRDRQRIGIRPIARGLAATAAGFVAFHIVGQATDGLPARLPAEIRQVVTLPPDRYDPDVCTFKGPVEDTAVVAACYDPGKTVYLIGDSHARALALSMRPALEADGHTFISWVAHGCMPIPGTSRPRPDAECQSYKDQLFAFLEDHPGTLVMASRWRLSLIGVGFDNEEGGKEYQSGLANIVVGDRSRSIFDHVSAELSRIASAYPTVIVDQIPEAGWEVPNKMGKAVLLGESDSVLSTSYEVYKRANRKVMALLARIPGATVVHTADLVCEEATGRCLNELDGRPLYHDSNHPAQPLAEMITRKVRGALRAGVDS